MAGCESRQSLQEQGPPRPQLLFSPKELQPQRHEPALTAIQEGSQTGAGVPAGLSLVLPSCRMA